MKIETRSKNLKLVYEITKLNKKERENTNQKPNTLNLEPFRLQT